MTLLDKYLCLSLLIVQGCEGSKSVVPQSSDSGSQYSGSAFVHLFEWSWADIAQECEDWLGPKGFNAVQISPPNEHIQGSQWWTRYQPVTYKLVSRSGDEAAFTDMVQRCKKAGVGIYADAVLNHIAAGSGTGVAGGQYGGRSTPIYQKQDMHYTSSDMNTNCGVTNYQDKYNVQYCDLVSLPDLCTSCQKVKELTSDYINRMAAIGIAGFRIDAAKHMDAGELGQLLSNVSKDLYRFQEVISGGGEAVKPEMYYSNGQVTEFNYARTLAPNFQQTGKFQYLKTFGENWGFMPSGNAVVFFDNHDTQRGEAQLTYKDGKLYQLANVFMLAHPYGYPKVMSSYFFSSHDQGPPSSPVHQGSSLGCAQQPSAAESDAPWVCEHRWTAIANMVGWRKTAHSSDVTSFQVFSPDVVAFCRGQVACVIMNRQDSSSWSGNVKFTMPAGKYCDVIQSDDVSSCSSVTIEGDGTASVNVPPLGAVAVHTGKSKGSTTSFEVLV